MNNGLLPFDTDASAERDGGASRRVFRRIALGAALFVLSTVLVRIGMSATSQPPTPRTAKPSASPLPSRSDTLAHAPSGMRIRVRVLNTTSTRGLAKRVTSSLRELGYDVVDFDSDPKSARTSTVILSHTGHDVWAQRLRRALGTGVVEASSDSLRYVDFTVLVGSDWKPPTQSFRP